MAEDYFAGKTSTNAQATTKAIDIAIKYHNAAGIDDKTTWNKGGWPDNLGSRRTVNSFSDIFNALKNNGLIYGYFSSDKGGAHLVVIVGAISSIMHPGRDYLIINNPWGRLEIATYDGFLKGYGDLKFTSYYLWK